MHELDAVRHLTAHLVSPVAACVGSLNGLPPGGSIHDRLRLGLRRCIRSHASADGRPVVHAAAAELAGVGVLMPGRTRAGKSTLAVALAHDRGAKVASDDLVLVRGADVEAFGAPLSIRSDSPYAAVARSTWYADDSDRLLVRADDVGSPEIPRHLTIGLVAFPVFGHVDESIRLTPAASFCRLLSSLVYPLDRTAVLQLARTTAQLPAIEMRYRSTEEALRQLGEALASMSPTPATPVDELPPDELSGFRDAVTALRFAGDQVVVIHPHRKDVILLDGWPAGTTVDVPSWSALTRGRI